jgi:hypothetical protein
VPRNPTGNVLAALRCGPAGSGRRHASLAELPKYYAPVMRIARPIDMAISHMFSGGSGLLLS